MLEALPEVTASEVVGLLEYLDHRGGKEDIFRIASDTNTEFGRIISVVEAAELLDFVDTPKRMVVLESRGVEFVRAMPDDRKPIWRRQLLKLQLFKMIAEVLERQPEHQLDRDFVLETLVMRLPQEKYEKIFETFIRWARFGNLFAYDEDRDVISLQ
jgi:NitT/TauT family transport system ATP-binding protein